VLQPFEGNNVTNTIIPFSFQKHEVRAVVIGGEEHLVGKDVCDVLGYSNHSDAMAKHCRGVAKRYPILDSLGRPQEARVLSEADVLRLIVSSKLPAAIDFERWVFEEVLPTIRKTGGYQMPSPTRQSPKLEAEMAGAELYVRLLRPAPSSQVAMIAHIVKNNGGDPTFLPAYTVDAAPDQVAGSSMPTKPLKSLLADHGLRMSPQAFNKLLIAAGFLEDRTRPSTSSPGGVSKFKSITEAGLRFGKKITSPSNPRETQPHWYAERFASLCDLVLPIDHKEAA
jgi:prophage antirepressor-like protein